MSDASGYLYAAVNHWKTNYRPYGYSAFLNLTYGINKHLWFVTFSQYLLYSLSISVFIFTIARFFSPGKIVFYCLSALCILSPVSLYFTNYAISDSLFSSLSILWITTGIWLFHYRKAWLVVIHLVIMLLVVYVRYAGLIYPVISAILFLLAFRREGWLKKICISFVPLLLFMLFYKMQVSAIKRETGVNTFSGFSGWSLANNAVSVLPFVDIKEENLREPELKLAHYFIKQQPDSVYIYDINNVTAFIWTGNQAGKNLLMYIMQERKQEYFQAWVYTGHIWGRYGSFLIKNYPVEFLQHFILPNLKQVFYPTRVYSTPCQNIPVSDLIHSRYKDSPANFSYRQDIMASMLGIIRVGNLLGWLALAGAVIVFAFLRQKLQLDKTQTYIILFGITVIALYTGFILIGHPFEQRYIINIHVLKVLVPVIIFSHLITNRKAAQKSS